MEFEFILITIGIFVLCMLPAFIIQIDEYERGVLFSRGKFKNQAKLPLISAFIFFPLFILIQIPLDVTSLFIRNLKWRKIPHGVNKNN